MVKEEKLLMIAMESNEQKQIIQAVKDIVSACTFDKLDIDNMPMVDVEYVFLQIRAKSVGEVVKLKVTCPDDKKTQVEIEVDLSTIQVTEELKAVLPSNYINMNFIAPFKIEGKVLHIAISDISKLSLMRNLRTITKMDIELHAAKVSDISNFVDKS